MRWIGMLAATVGVLLLASVADAQTCDIRRELLEFLLALERYRGLAIEAVTVKRVSLSDAVKAGNEFTVADQRLNFMCQPGLRPEGSSEKRIYLLAKKRGHGLGMMLLGTLDPKEPSVREGNEAALELSKVSFEYFKGK